MKAWAKILVWIGIIWIILATIGLLIFYIQLDKIATNTQNTASSGNMEPATGFLSTINLNSPINSLFKWFLLLSIPSIILFLISWIFGKSDQ